MVVESDFTSELVGKAENNFKNIKDSIKGVLDILNMLSEEDVCKFYLKIAEENLTGLYLNFLELLSNDYGLRKVVKKIRNSELDLDIDLDEISLEEDL